MPADNDPGQDLTWYEVDPKPGLKAARWQRRAAIGPDGTVFIPAAISGLSEQATFLCANYDGIPVAVFDGHPYLPAAWLAIEYPATADVAEKIARKIRERFAVEGGA